MKDGYDSSARRVPFLHKADQCKPELKSITVFPAAVVDISRNEAGAVGIAKAAPAQSMAARPMKKDEELILDFGTHVVGYLTLRLRATGNPQDSPAYLRLKFSEIAREIPERSSDYNGWLSKSWIQEEFLHIDELPAEITLPRRYAFRFLQIQVIDTSPKWQLVVESASCRAVSAVDDSQIAHCLQKWQPFRAGLPDQHLKQRLAHLEQVSLLTLKNCMQDVFEDGPKRDRRLWLGDLRLQALANYASFHQNNLVKRCLYLFAGLPGKKGRMGACLFTRPDYLVDNVFLFDYALFFICTLHDYYRATGDRQTLLDLWDTAAAQLKLAACDFDSQNRISAQAGENSFIDWKAGLDKQTSAQGIYLYAARALLELAQVLNKQTVVERLTREIQDKTQAARQYAWDPEKGLFVSGPQRQISYASQVWMILAKVVDPEAGARILDRLQTCPEAIGMSTPYMNHYFTEALFLCGKSEEAIRHLDSYWGGMLDQGADTFWELYNPEDPQESPYGSCMVHSYCHAWSCTPVYLIHTYIDHTPD